MPARHRALRRPFRAAIAAIAAVAAGAVIATGVVAPALADDKMDFTVKVASQKGTALSGVTVEAIPMQDGHPIESDPTWPLTATKVSGHTGWYKFTGTQQLTIGAVYTLLFAPSGSIANSTFTQLLGGVQEWARAETFAPGLTYSSLDTTLRVNGVLSGKVTSPSGKAVSGAVVYAYSFDGTGWAEVAHAKTSSSGKYSIYNLEPGSYKLEFDKANTYPTVYSGGATTLDGAVAYNVGLGKVVTANAKFATGGTISGTTIVYDDGSGYDYYLAHETPIAYPLLGAPGSYTPDTSRPSYGTDSDKHGKWSIKGLGAGPYAVFLESSYVDVPSGYLGDHDVVSGWYTDYAVTVSAGKTTATGTAELYFSDYVEGNVTLTVSGPAAAVADGVHIRLQNDVAPDWYYDFTTNSSGIAILPSRYSAPAGNYTVTITDPEGRFDPYTSHITLQYSSTAFSFAMSAYNPIAFTAGPTIDNSDLAVGQTYTVSATTNRTTTLDYEWMRGGVPVYGADGASYTTVGADVGKVLSVRVYAEADNIPTLAQVVTVGTVAEGEQLANSQPPAITTSDGSVHTDSVLHVLPGTWSEPGVTLGYQWLRDGADIDGATSSTFTVPLSDYQGGHALSVRVVAQKAGFPQSDPVTTDAVVPSLAPALIPSAAFKITTSTSHLPKGSKKYTVAAGKWSSSTGVTFGYSWSVDGAAAASTATSYISTAADIGPITVTVTADKDGYTQASVSQVVRKGAQALTSTGSASVLDGATILAAATHVTVDDVLHVDASGLAWSVPAGSHQGDATMPTYTYQWYRQSGSSRPAAISKATASSYMVSSSDIGKKLTVKVTASSIGWGSVVMALTAGTGFANTALVDAPATVTLSGNREQTYPVTAVVSSWAAPGVTTSYQWYWCKESKCPTTFNASKFSKVSGATKSSYTPTSEGQTYVAVTGKKSGYTTKTVLSAPLSISSGKYDVLHEPVILASSARVGSSVSLQTQTSYGPISPYDRTIWWELCDSAVHTCDTDADWTTLSQVSSPTLTVANYGTGASYLRYVEMAWGGPNGLEDTYAQSAPVPVLKGTLPTSTPTISKASNICTVTTPSNSKAGLPVGETWYSGSTQLTTGTSFDYSGSNNPDPTVPLYVVVTYQATDYDDLNVPVLCIAGSGAPAVVPGISVTNAVYGSQMTLSVAPADAFDVPAPLKKTVVAVYKWVFPNGSSYGATFMPPVYDVGDAGTAEIWVVSPYYLNGVSASVTSYPTGTIQPGTIAVTSGLSVTPTEGVTDGTTVNAVAPVFANTPDGAPTVVSRWELSEDDGTTWNPIPGATGVTFIVPNAMVGDEVRYTSSASRAGYTTVTLASDPISVASAGVIANLAAPTIGSAQVGVPIAADAGSWSAGTALTYQWLRNGVAIPGASGLTLTPDATTAGDSLQLLVTATKAHETTVTVGSNIVVVAPGASPIPTTKPKKTVSGATLSVTTGAWNVSGVVFSYEWYDGDTQIPDATQSSYTLSGGQIAANIHVIITATAIGYAPGSVTL